jgi:hypothetical protein
MTGTVKNKDEEIEFICDMKRHKIDIAWMIDLCNMVWKHKVRTMSSARYVLANWKDKDP